MISSLLLMSFLNSVSLPPVLIQDDDDDIPQHSDSLPVKCSPRSLFIDRIKEKFDAVPVFVGIMKPDGTLSMEIWKDTKDPGDNWVSFITGDDGISCIVAQGHGMVFEDHPESQEPSGKSQFNSDRPKL